MIAPMPIAIKTLGPLHIEDLEPHRFEDLIRQLLYDFRDWSEIEATGRSGGDEGFDTRAWERWSEPGPVGDSEADDDAREEVADGRGRQWLVQCKRERTITPAKIERYLADLPDTAAEGLYGLLFVAACDFSKATRDRFITIAREKGFLEARLWGRAEIEDQLFQPKNDHLLFAYCGFSLQVRRRSLKTNVRAILATKRAVRKLQGGGSHILLRDAADTRYPFMDLDTGDDRADRGRWKMFGMRELRHDGLELCIQRFLAFIDDDGVHWDYAEGMNDARAHDDPWVTEAKKVDEERERSVREAAMTVWDALKPENKAWLEVTRVVPYERIVAIDEEGDEYARWPHVYYVSADGNPFTPYEFDSLSAASMYDHRRCHPRDETRVAVFARGQAVQPSAVRGGCRVVHRTGRRKSCSGREAVWAPRWLILGSYAKSVTLAVPILG